MRIFQGYFDDVSRQYCEEPAELLDIRFNRDHPLYEYNIFRKLLKDGIIHPDGGPVGLLSWKFRTKTLIDVGTFHAFCEKAFADGADVVFINPMIAAEALFLNVWEQGGHGHRNMTLIIEALFSPEECAQLALMPKTAFAFCNYFVGNYRFWSEYMVFCDEMLAKIEAFKETNPPAYEMIHGSARYRRNQDADFRPFIIERLFSSLLILKSGIRSAAFDYGLNIYQKKFGAEAGQQLFRLSRVKNECIRSGDALQQWNAERVQMLMNHDLQLDNKDDPSPGPPPGKPATGKTPDSRKMRIFQGYFDDVSRQYCEEPAELLDIRFNRDHPLFEYNIFKKLLKDGIIHPDGGPVGCLSWKFRTKTLVDVRTFHGFCEKAFADGADVAFINPMIAAEATFANVWEQAAQGHGYENTTAIVEALFSPEEKLQLTLMPKTAFAFCNYFVGTYRFWAEYMEYCDGMLRKIEGLKETNPAVYELVYGSAQYRRNAAIDFRPFIIERLFSSLLVLRKGIKAVSFDYSPDTYKTKFGIELGNQLLQLSHAKNEGIRTGSENVIKGWDEARLAVLKDRTLLLSLRDDPAEAPLSVIKSRRSKPPVRIYQGYFDDASKQRLSPAAEPLDIGFNVNHPLYEYNIFKTMMARGMMDSGPVGLVSWKFETKALAPLGEFKAICEQSFAEGCEVAFINPMIAAEALYKNVWEQGEHVGHRGCLAIAQALFTPEQCARMDLMPRSAFAFCNYFAATRTFWEKYFAFCDGVLKKIESFKKTNPGIHALIHGTAHYHRNNAADFRPFIIERLLSTFLMLFPDIMRAGFICPQETYERKFGTEAGKYLFLLSGIKHNGITSQMLERLKKWDELRQPVLKNPVEIWLKDDPQAQN